MIITWYGQSCFKIETREAVIAIDPFSRDIGLTPPRFHADLVLVSHEHHDHNNIAAISGRGAKGEGAGGAGEPLVINGPGEYEVKNIAIAGVAAFHDSLHGRERGVNTIYRLEAEDLVVAHLGDFGESGMREETMDALGNVDILMIPVGGTYTVTAEGAAKIVNQIEPRLVIPMHYHLTGLKIKLAPVENFLEAASAPNAERLEKLTVRKKDLPEEETRVVVLKTA